MTTIEEESRGQIAEFLPKALKTAIKSYDDHMEKTTTADFVKHHTAGKAAIAHIELLLKLARWVDAPKAGGGGEAAVLAAMMQEAEAEVAAYEQQDNSSEE